MNILFRFLFLLFLPCFAWAQLPQPKSDGYVNDYTNSLYPTEIRDLNEQLKVLEQQTAIQVAILLIDRLPKGTALEDYARNIGNEWKVARDERGILYVGVLQERVHRLEIANRLTLAISDSKAQEMIDNLQPALRQQQYYQALHLLITQISVAIRDQGPALADTTAESRFLTSTYSSETGQFEKEKAKYDYFGNYIIAGIVAIMIAFSFWAWRYKKTYVRKHTINGVYMGIGTHYFTSNYPDYYDTDQNAGSTWSGDSGSTGGGDSFSGGGASGDW